MQTLEQVKEEIYDRMLIIAEPRARYIPGSNKQVDALLAELRIISSQRGAGEPIPPERRERFSEIVTKLNKEYNVTIIEMATLIGMNRRHLSDYIKKRVGTELLYDEKRLKHPEDKDALIKELKQIASQRTAGKYIPPHLKERFSEVVTKLNKVNNVTLVDMAEMIGMTRGNLAEYMHMFIQPSAAEVKPFPPGANPTKKIWWKKQGRSYRDIWSFAQDITGVSPVVTKGDYRKIAVEAVNYVNANEPVKNQLLDFIETDAFTSMQSMSGYRMMAQIPISFVQWLSDTRGREITLEDLDFETKHNPKGITASMGQRFVNDYVPEKSPRPGEPAIRSETSQAHVRAALIKFFKFLEIQGKIEKYPMLGMKIGMERKINPVVYNINDLDEIFNKIISGKPAYYSLFMRLLLQIGSRPGQIFSIKCKDLEFGTATKDAFGRDFYPINPKKILEEEKGRRGEKVQKKYAPGTAMISARLKNDLEVWCKSNNISPNDAIFEKFIQLGGIQEGIRARTHILSGYKKVEDRWVEDKTRMKALSHDPDYYSLYGLRHTWASVIYNITKDVKYVTTSGGWASGSSVPVDVYVQSRAKSDVMDIAKKWEIYIDPEYKADVEKVEKEKEKEAPAAMGAVELKKLEDTQKLLIDQLNAMAKKIEELEGKKNNS
jgi:integrase/predicted HTH domain antitoxin